MIKTFYLKTEKFQGKCWFSFEKLIFHQKTMSPSKLQAILWLVDNFQIENIGDVACFLPCFFVFNLCVASSVKVFTRTFKLCYWLYLFWCFSQLQLLGWKQWNLCKGDTRCMGRRGLNHIWGLSTILPETVALEHF